MIVSVTFAAFGLPLAYRYAPELFAQDFSLPKTRQSLERGKDTFANKAQDIRNTIQNTTYNPNWR